MPRTAVCDTSFPSFKRLLPNILLRSARRRLSALPHGLRVSIHVNLSPSIMHVKTAARTPPSNSPNPRSSEDSQKKRRRVVRAPFFIIHSRWTRGWSTGTIAILINVRRISFLFFRSEPIGSWDEVRCARRRESCFISDTPVLARHEDACTVLWRPWKSIASLKTLDAL